jgi:hypothetical protein
MRAQEWNTVNECFRVVKKGAHRGVTAGKSRDGMCRRRLWPGVFWEGAAHMSTEPMLRCGGALVVYDGPHRLIWNRISAARWTPTRLWPNRTEAAVVTESMSRGDPLLIILDRRTEPIHVLVEELATAPREVTDLVCSVAGDVAELRIPRLCWLPDHLVERGQRFLQDVAATVARSPRLLLPSLILEERDNTPDTVWFGLRVRSASWSVDEVKSVVDHLRAGRRRATMSAVS